MPLVRGRSPAAASSLHSKIDNIGALFCVIPTVTSFSDAFS